jgi:putative transposase
LWWALTNNHHRHMNLGLLTPAGVHSSAAGRILDQRRVVLEEAYALHPQRFVRGIP